MKCLLLCCGQVGREEIDDMKLTGFACRLTFEGVLNGVKNGRLNIVP